MKLGIATTTYNRPAHLEMWTKLVAENSPEDAVFHIANDTKERKGVAYRKTECIRELYNAGCEVMFVFDDDCFPIKKGWCDFFIEALQASEQNHFCYLKETPGVKLISCEEHFWSQGYKSLFATEVFTINRYDNCNGCLMVMTRKAVETVGAFNPVYGIYGGEHGEWTHRCYRAGLNPMGAYLCPAGASEYIYSCDLDFHKPEIQKKLRHHKSGMSSKEKVFHARKSMQIQEDQNIIYLPL